MNRKQSKDFDPELLDLYDKYAHGILGRRDFFARAAKFAVGGVTAAMLLEAMSPNYAWAQQVPKDDARIKTEYAAYDSPNGHGKMRGYLARPSGAAGKLPGVLVVHENRGLNPYVEDVARRLAVDGFLAFAPDGLTPAGGYPGNDDEGRKLQAELDKGKLEEDFVSAAEWLEAHPECDGKVGVTGFCYGGGISGLLAWRLPDLIKAAAPYYGRQPDAENVPKIKASLQIHYGELDQRVNAGWPAFEEALKASGASYEVHFYAGANHGFHNDTTPRYDEANAKLAWERTVAFFKAKLG